jgi:predicted ester cyclase
MSPDELKARARRVAEELLTQGDLAVADELFDSACRHHAPCPVPPGAGGAKRWAGDLRRAFSDLRAVVEHEVAEGDAVVQRLTLIGTHDGPFSGLAPTGRLASWEVVEILRVGPDGRFAERWSGWDQLGLLRQLGAAPPMADGSP